MFSQRGKGYSNGHVRGRGRLLRSSLEAELLDRGTEDTLMKGLLTSIDNYQFFNERTIDDSAER